MMPTIRIDDDVYEQLKQRAEPFTDTPNTVLRRLLDLDAPADDPMPTRKKQPKLRPGDLLDRREYDLRILEVLDRIGGSGYAPDVVEEVGKLVGDRLTEADHLKNNSGSVRWKNRVMWRRFKLVQLGLLESDSPRGTWTISKAGRQALKDGRIAYS